MKRFAVLTITVVLLLCALACGSAYAVAAHSDGQCGENVYYRFDASTAVLTISGSGSMYNAGTAQFVSPFAGDTEIQKIVLTRGVTSVGSGVFEGCSNLISVELPDTVAAIGTRAFAGCEKLNDVRLLARQTDFGTAVFPQQAVIRCYYGSSAAVYANAQNLQIDFFDKIETYGFSMVLTATKFQYTGKAVKPAALVKDDNGKTVSAKYYTLVYDANPGAVGVHSVKLQFLAPYAGSKTLKYTVAPKLKMSTAMKIGEKSKVYVYAYDTVKKNTVYFNDKSSFSSSDISVALISKSGTVMAVGGGKTTITINTNGNISRYVLSVKQPPIFVNGAVQYKKGGSIPYGATYTYIELAYHTKTPEAKYFYGKQLLATHQETSFTSYRFVCNNNAIVKVDADGEMQAGGKTGTAIVTIAAKYAGKTYYKKVYVIVKANTKAAPYFYNQLLYSHITYDNPSTERKETIATSGCGVCSTAMVVNNMARKQLCSVASLARFSVAHKARDNYGTNMFTLLDAVCNANSHFSYSTTKDTQKLLKHLKSGGMAIINQGDNYRVFSSAGHFVVAYKAVGENVEVFDPYWYEWKYSAERTVFSTSRGCIVNISEIAKATADRNPAYYLISYSKKPLKNTKIQPLDANQKTTVKKYAKPITLYCTTTGGLNFRKSPSTSSGLVQGTNGGASVIGHRDAVSAIAVASNAQGKWYQVRYRGHIGYVSAKYVSTSRPSVKTIIIPKGRNLRSSVGTKAKVLAITKKQYKAVLLVDSYWQADGYNWSRITIGKKNYYFAM